MFVDWASTSSCDRLFNPLMTRWEKKYKCVSQPLCFFTSFQVCPVVEVLRPFLKQCDQRMDDSPWIILNNSIKSALFLLSSRVHRPSWRNMFSHDNDLRRGNIRVKRCCILSNKSLSLFMWVPCGWAIWFHNWFERKIELCASVGYSERLYTHSHHRIVSQRCLNPIKHVPENDCLKLIGAWKQNTIHQRMMRAQWRRLHMDMICRCSRRAK